jgi:hypothetical protein
VYKAFLWRRQSLAVFLLIRDEFSENSSITYLSDHSVVQMPNAFCACSWKCARMFHRFRAKMHVGMEVLADKN